MKQRLSSARGTAVRWTSFTRQGALAAARRVSGPVLVPPARTTAVLVSGSMLIGAGIAAFRSARIGLPPYDVLLSAIAERAGVSHGQAGWALAAVLIAVAMVLGQRLMAASVVMVFANGVSVDAASVLLGPAGDPITRGLLWVAGLVLLAAGLSLIVFSGKGRGPFEMLMAAGAARGRDEIRIRTVLEVLVLVLGLSGGGEFGPGTVMFAVLIGPVLQRMIQALADHRTGREVRLATMVA